MHFQKYFAELVGTFFLTTLVSFSILNTLPFPTPLVAGLTVGLFVYTVGAVSGAHFNPAVTIGLWTVRKINLKDAVAYILAQLVGAYLALQFVQTFTGKTVALTVGNTWSIGLAEALGAFLLVFGISAVIHQKVHAAASGIVIGGSLMLGILLAAGFSNAILNPAVALGLHSVSWAYMLAPVVGGILAAWVFKFLGSPAVVSK